MKEPLKYEELLAQQGYSVSTTVGVSMYPMLRNRRDTIVIRPVEGRLEKYDVPLYKSHGNYVLHRIIKVLPDAYIIRGDNCVQKEYVTDDMIVGVLAEFYRNPKHGATKTVKPVKMHGSLYKIYVYFWHFTFPVRYFYKRARAVAGRIKRRITG